MAWHQRQACRDLYDLAALADVGALTRSAVDFTYDVTNSRIGYHALNHKLTPKVLNKWDDQLAHQLDNLLSAEACLEIVLEALLELEESPS